MMPSPAWSPSAWEDAVLVRRLRAGHAAALARIYAKHRLVLLRVASGLLHDRALAEDAVQDVFLGIARAPERVQSNGNLRAFLCVSVANRARNARRTRQSRGVDAADPEALPAGDASPAGWLLQNDRLEAAAAALAELPAEQREAVVLHLQGGLSFREVAAATDVSINTAQSRYRYGLERLRARLNGAY